MTLSQESMLLPALPSPVLPLQPVVLNNLPIQSIIKNSYLFCSEIEHLINKNNLQMEYQLIGKLGNSCL